MKDFLSKGGRTSVQISKMDDTENSAVWTTKKIDQLLADFENGLIDIKTIKNSPFKDNDPAWKKPNLVFEYTPEELEEIKKCKSDVGYFANKYAQVLTEYGVEQIILRDYQEEIIRAFGANRFNILMASRQIGKTVMSGVFVAWYLIFHTDKNVLAVANIASTTKEVVDKIKSIFENLPFFLKPGCISNNVMSMKFDNGCRLIGRTTTKNTGIGFTIHLLYIDEFAHISPAYLDFFYRAIYPTISASTTSKIIITSTPNGMNRFYEIYMDALNGLNTYSPLRVDWWQVPGRDDKWKAETIANMGSEEDFNQEYGLQFFSSDRLLLSSKDLKKIFSIATKYEEPLKINWDPEVLALMEGNFTVHPNLKDWDEQDFRNSPDQYVFSVDTADGTGKDFSVINIFKAVALPIKTLEPIKNLIKSELDCISLVQVATWRSNKQTINEYAQVLEYLVYRLFNFENLKVLIELNHKGDFILDKIANNDQYWPGQLIHSKHTEATKILKPGLKLSVTNKIKFCERFKYHVNVNKILPNESKTVMELGSFGRSTNGTYRSQSGNDDLAMTCVNSAAFFDSPSFLELGSEVWDRTSEEYKKTVTETILNSVQGDGSAKITSGLVGYLNDTPQMKKPGQRQVFDENYLDSYKQTLSGFYGDQKN